MYAHPFFSVAYAADIEPDFPLIIFMNHIYLKNCLARLYREIILVFKSKMRC